MTIRIRRGRAVRPRIGVLLTLGLFLACGGGEPAETAEGAAPAATAQPAALETPALDDPALVERGEQLFAAKACGGCHTIGGGRLTGPDLAGVTERRDYPWLSAMIMRPDSMVREDQTARQLFMQYATPMPNLNLTRAEADALIAFLSQAGVTP